VNALHDNIRAMFTPEEVKELPLKMAKVRNLKP